MNNLDLVRQVIADLLAAGFEALLFGGWGEELLGLAEPRTHQDIDIVLVDPTLSALDAYVAAREKIPEKELSHKRAYLQDGVLVELFIARRLGATLETLFWDRLRWCWPGDMAPVTVEGLPVAPVAAHRAFRESYTDVMAARDAARAAQEG